VSIRDSVVWKRLRVADSPLGIGGHVVEMSFSLRGCPVEAILRGGRKVHYPPVGGDEGQQPSGEQPGREGVDDEAQVESVWAFIFLTVF